MKIGLFDSGLGGLEILNAVRKQLPQYDYAFYGDTANVPYGDRTEAEVYEFTKVGVAYLFEKGAVLVVLACNTASAETAHRLQQEWLPKAYPGRKILGVIVPTVELIAEEDFQEVRLIGTSRTVASMKYERELEKLNVDVILHTNAAPDLVPLIEAGKLQEAVKVLERLLESNAREGEVVIFVCTHYSVLDQYLSTDLKKKFTFIYQTEIIPKKLESYLERHKETCEELTIGGTATYHFTGKSPASSLLGKKV